MQLQDRQECPLSGTVRTCDSGPSSSSVHSPCSLQDKPILTGPRLTRGKAAICYLNDKWSCNGCTLSALCITSAAYGRCGVGACNQSHPIPSRTAPRPSSNRFLSSRDSSNVKRDWTKLQHGRTRSCVSSQHLPFEHSWPFHETVSSMYPPEAFLEPVQPES